MLNIPCLGLVPMTRTKTLLGISLAAVFAISMIASQTAVADELPEYLQIEETKSLS